MKDALTYNGHLGPVHCSGEGRVLFGKVEYVRSLISYEGTDADPLRSVFRGHTRSTRAPRCHSSAPESKQF
jgi:hypothetical protein